MYVCMCVTHIGNEQEQGKGSVSGQVQVWFKSFSGALPSPQKHPAASGAARGEDADDFARSLSLSLFLSLSLSLSRERERERE